MYLCGRLYGPLRGTVRSYSTTRPQAPSTTSGTFVSNYFKFDPETIHNYLNRKQFKFTFSPVTQKVNVQICPFCHDTKGKQDNQWKLYINGVSGTYMCFRCSAKGSWFDFQKKLGDLSPVSSFSQNQASGSASAFIDDDDDDDIFADPPSRLASPTDKSQSSNQTSNTTKQANAIQIEKALPSVQATSRPGAAPEQWKLAKTIQNLDHYPKVLEYLTKERGLTRETINAYKVGAGTFRFLDDKTQKWVDYPCVTFPWLQRTPAAAARLREAQQKSQEKKEEIEELEESTGEAENSTNEKKPEERPDTQDKKAADTSDTTKNDTTNDNTNIKPKFEDEFMLVRMKYRPIIQKTFRLDPAGGLWGLFGWDLIKPEDTEIVLTVSNLFILLFLSLFSEYLTLKGRRVRCYGCLPGHWSTCCIPP